MDMKVVVQALAAMAWADGSIDPRQKGLLAELLQLEGLEHPEWLEGPVPFPAREQLEGVLSEPSDRLDFVTQLLHVALADQVVNPAEASLLRQLGAAFGLDEEMLSHLQG